jgi:hypothetical protein
MQSDIEIHFASRASSHVLAILGPSVFGRTSCRFILDMHEPSHLRLASNTRDHILLTIRFYSHC